MPRKGEKKEITWDIGPKGCFLVNSHARNMEAGGHIPFLFDGKLQNMHRIFYAYVYGPIPKGIVIRHTCDESNCVNLNHLIPGTQADNIEDMRSRGRAYKPTGSANPKSKLTEDQVRCIRTISYIYPRKELQKMFGISKAMLAKILNKIHWSHIE